MNGLLYLSENNFDTKVINEILEDINQFDLSTYILKPEEIQDILQEVYMELIPAEMRHLMGEYFSPDWIVEHALDMVGYHGDIKKTLIDPTAGSGTFLTHSIKRIVNQAGGKLSRDDIDKITHNIIGFDINLFQLYLLKQIIFLLYFRPAKILCLMISQTLLIFRFTLPILFLLRWFIPKKVN